MHGTRAHSGRGGSRKALSKLTAALAAATLGVGLACGSAAAAVPSAAANAKAAAEPGMVGAKAPAFARATAPKAVKAAKPAADTPPTDASGALATIVASTGSVGYVAAGVAMRDIGHGTIDITGVPDGATVQSATLLWDILGNSADPSYEQGTIGSDNFDGTLVDSGPTPCWGVNYNLSYEADVTSAVTGNGEYKLTNFASGLTDGSDPWTSGEPLTPPLLEGATLVVVYKLSSLPDSSIQIDAGAAESEDGDSADATLSGFTAASPVTASTTFIVADGQLAGNTASVGETDLSDVGFPGSATQDAPNYSQGNLWDTVTTDVSDEIKPGATSVPISVTGGDDCIVWVGQVLDVQTGSICPTECLQAANAVAALDAGDIHSPSGLTYDPTVQFASDVEPLAGFAAAQFTDSAGNVIIADEGVKPSLDHSAGYAAGSANAIRALYKGKWTSALNDAVQYAIDVKASLPAGTPLYVTGFDLGGVEAEAQAQALQSQITGGATFGAPGLPGYSLTSVEGDLVNYVEYGDPIGNWTSDPGGELDGLTPAHMNHYGRVDPIGNENAAAIDLMAVHTFNLSGTKQLRKLLTKNVAKPSKITKALRLAAIKSVRALAVYQDVMSNAKYALFAGGTLAYHRISVYAADLGVTITPVATPPLNPAVFFDEFDPSATHQDLDEDAETTVSPDGAVDAPGDYTLTADPSTGDLTGVDFDLSPNSNAPYDVAFDPEEEISSLSANDPSGQSYELVYDESGAQAWVSSTEYFSGPDESGTLEAVVYNWRSGGSQAQLFVDLPAHDTAAIYDYSKPDATGKLLSTTYES